MKLKIKHLISIACLATSVSTSPVFASAVSIGFGDGISYQSTHMNVPGLNLYEIGGPLDGFIFDPGAGAWEKTLIAPENGFQPGEIYTVREWFTFNPPPAGIPNVKLADWHESISLSPDGQIWDVWTLEFGPPVISFDPDSNQPIPGLEFGISADGLDLWFDFDPINIGPDGLTLHIEKSFRYTGSTVSFDPVIITQYPTPTPGSLALLGLAGITATRRKR